MYIISNVPDVLVCAQSKKCKMYRKMSKERRYAVLLFAFFLSPILFLKKMAELVIWVATAGCVRSLFGWCWMELGWWSNKCAGPIYGPFPYINIFWNVYGPNWRNKEVHWTIELFLPAWVPWWYRNNYFLNKRFALYISLLYIYLIY